MDGKGWPLVHPVWHVVEDGMFRLGITKTSVKARRLRAEQRAYFTVDTGSGPGGTRGVRGRAGARVIDGDVGLAVDLTRKQLLEYMGTDVVELTPVHFAAFSY